MTETVPVEFKSNDNLQKKLIPLLLGVGLLLLDQITKLIIVSKIPPYTIGCSFFGDFLQIIHVRNLGIAFSIGNGLPQLFRALLFSIIPVAVLILVMIVYFKNNDFTSFQRWMISGIVGGGIGNLIDRVFRPSGVVDFIDIKFFGIFGFERWPTFNVADMSVLICGILLFISFLNTIIHEKKV